MIKRAFNNGLFNPTLKESFNSRRRFCDAIGKCPGREHKYYILNYGVGGSFDYADVLERFNSMRGKVTLKVGSKVDQQLFEDFVEFVKNEEIEGKPEFITKSVDDHNEKFYLSISKSKYPPLLENDLGKLRSLWPKELLDQQKSLLNKTMMNKISFKIVNESKGAVNNMEIEVEINTPELLFGVTFIKLRKSEAIKLKLIPELSDNSGFLLNTSIYAVNPINEEKLRILITASDSAFSAGIPAHDQQDHDLALKFGLPVKVVAKSLSEMGETLMQEENAKKNRNVKLGTAGGLLMPKQPTVDDIKKELIQNKNKGPVLLTEGFLINSKEFDYLYLEEARDLLVNHLIRKGKAKRTVWYNIDHLFLGKMRREGSNKVFEMSDALKLALSYLRSFFNKEREGSCALIQDKFLSDFKKWMPVDVLLYNSENKVHTESVLYSRIIHRLLLDYFLSKRRLPIQNEREDEEVFLNKEQELAKDVLFPTPFKEVIALKGNNEKIEEKLKQIEMLLESLHKNYSSSSITGLNIDSLTDEKIKINESSSNLVVKIYKEIVEVVDTMTNPSPDDKVLLSLVKLNKYLSNLTNNSPILSQYPNFFTFLYLNTLIIVHPFHPEGSTKYYKQLESIQSKFKSPSVFKEEVKDHSIDKLYQTCKFFIEMLSNTVRLELVINSEEKGNILLDRSIVQGNDQSEIIIHLKEIYVNGETQPGSDSLRDSISQLKLDKVEKIEVENNKLVIILK